MYLRLFFGFLVTCALALGVLPAMSSAQSSLSQTTNVHLSIEPNFPAPESSAVVSLEAYTIDTTGATISWFIDGKEQVGYKNERSIPIDVPELGKKMAVTAKIARTGQPTFSPSLDIVPTSIDIILETDSFVPSFYKGRALPSGESTVRAIAVVNSAKAKPASAYSYLWEQNGAPFFGGPVTGKSEITLTMPRYEGDYLSVTAFDENGRAAGKRSISLTPVAPEIHFYEESLLRGLSRKALGNPYTLIGEESTIHALPYYMNTDLTTATTDFEWRLNGKRVETGNESPNAISLRSTGGAGRALLELKAITRTTIPQYLQGGLTILFN